MDEALKKTAFFLRSSAHDDAETESSLEAQEKLCSKRAQEVGGMEPESVCRERGSASDPERPELERLMQAARDNQMECVVVYDYSSLSRDPSKLVKMLQELSRLGVVVLPAVQRPPKSE